MDQTKKIVLLTGATGGLGTAIAKHLDKNIFKVYGAGRKKVNSPDYIPVYMDLSKPHTITKMLEDIIEKEERIDILINNAGIGITGSIEETSIENVKKVFEVNFFGMMQLIQEVLPYMRKNKKGKIINISSIAGYTGLPYRGIYSATKAAVMRMTEALSAELHPFGIKVIEIAPGDFKTKIAEGRIYTELKEDSPYYNDYRRILKMIDIEVEQGLEPEVLGKKLSKIIFKKNPRLTYNIGIFMQKLAPFLATCLPGRFFENLILKHYKIKK